MAERLSKRPRERDAENEEESSGSGPSLEITSPRALFADLVAVALGTLGTNPSPPAVAYLIGLLELQLRAPAAPELDRVGTATLAEGLLTAIAEDGRAQLSRLRALGDRALFVSGFFGESLHRRVPGLEYYAAVGRAAYSRLSGQLACSPADRGRGELFQELADEFGAFVELLAEVGGRARPEGRLDLLRVYDAYVQTGSERARGQLVRAGVAPPPAGSLRKWQ